jgi:hypothetical protein
MFIEKEYTENNAANGEQIGDKGCTGRPDFM